MLNINTQAQAKKSARALEKVLERNGISLQHGKALDVLASLCGRQDWNALSQALSPDGVDALLGDFERQHAADTEGDVYGEEAMLVAHTGFQLRYSSETEMCDYVRICDPLGREILYWHSDEWAEAPQLVMGAILGGLVRGRPVDVAKASAETAPVTKAASTAKGRVPTIQDVCFTNVSAVCINRGSGFRLNFVEDEVAGLLDETGSAKFDEHKEDTALYLERDGDDGDDPTYAQLTLEQLAELKWDATRKMFAANDGTTYEFYFAVTTQQWFDTLGSLAPTEQVKQAAVGQDLHPDSEQPLQLFTATFGSDSGPVMQMKTRIAGFNAEHAKSRLFTLYRAVPMTLSNVLIEHCDASEVSRYLVFVDGGYYDGVPTLGQAVSLANVLEPSASDEVSIEDEDGNCLWTVKAKDLPENLDS